MKENKYMNATKLCKEYNKRFEHWLENINSKNLIKEVEYELKNGDHRISGEPPKKATITLLKGCVNELKGTYVHELLIPHIASWISPVFAIKVSKIVNNFIIKEYKDSIKQKDDKIDELIQLNKEIKIQNDDMKKLVEKMNNKLDETHNKLDISNTKLDDVKIKLNKSLEERVPKLKEVKLNEGFYLMKNAKVNEYYAICRQMNSINNTVENYIKENKNAKVVFKKENIRDSKNVLQVIKKELSEYIIYKSNNLMIKYENNIKLDGKKIKHVEFIKKIEKIYDERYNEESLE